MASRLSTCETNNDGTPAPPPTSKINNKRLKSKRQNVVSAECGTQKLENGTNRKETAKASKSTNMEDSSSSTRRKTKRKEKDNQKQGFKNGAIIEGEQKKYTVNRLFRNPGQHAEYFVKDGDNERVLRFEPMERAKLKFMSEILRKGKIESDKSEDKRLFLLECFEYGLYPPLKSNYIVTNSFGIQLGELQKYIRVFTPGCAINIALQCLEAIRILHSCGYINRNIKPASFSVGSGTNLNQIYMTDFRLTRIHMDEATKEPRKARSSVDWLGTLRYASISAQREVDQGRKDDLESWIYMLYEIYDMENGLPWRHMSKDRTLREKEALRCHALAKAYKVVPEDFKKLLDAVHGLKYESAPDYAALKTILETFASDNKHEVNTCDWIDMLKPDAINDLIEAAKNKSVDNKCSGNDDFEFAIVRGKKKKPIQRKTMSPNDIIKNGPCVWKVVVLLGSGGFGDVYKVFNEKDPKKKNYALKTECEDGKKTMLRLKVEMQVMMTINESRKANPKSQKNNHFVEFVDRGKSDELKCKFIVMSLVGPSLDDCRKKYHINLSEKATPFVIAIQCLEAVRDLHDLGYLHRDIKPANFAVGIGSEESVIYMLDFGICRSYLDPKSKGHRAPRKSVKFLGTLRFASRACMKSTDQGRKDDLECWLYMVFDIMDKENGVPWRNVTDRPKILASKTLFFQNKLDSVYENVTRKMKPLVTYIDSLEYQSLPDYQFISSKLYKISESKGYPITNMKKVSWVGKTKNPPKGDRFASDSDSDEIGSGDDE